MRGQSSFFFFYTRATHQPCIDPFITSTIPSVSTTTKLPITTPNSTTTVLANRHPRSPLLLRPHLLTDDRPISGALSNQRCRPILLRIWHPVGELTLCSDKY